MASFTFYDFRVEYGSGLGPSDIVMGGAPESGNSGCSRVRRSQCQPAAFAIYTLLQPLPVCSLEVFVSYSGISAGNGIVFSFCFARTRLTTRRSGEFRSSIGTVECHFSRQLSPVSSRSADRCTNRASVETNS
jgi:hypothetical protein